VRISGDDVQNPTGDLDEIVATGADVHLERMSDQEWVLIVNEGKRQLIVNLTTKRERIGAFVFEDRTG
jgi:hypothetical protein